MIGRKGPAGAFSQNVAKLQIMSLRKKHVARMAPFAVDVDIFYMLSFMLNICRGKFSLLSFPKCFKNTQ